MRGGKTIDIRTLITWIGAAVAVFFMFRVGYANISRIPGWNFSVHPGLVILSIVIVGLAVIFRALIWRQLLNLLDNTYNLPHKESMKVFIYSWISRYIPGNIAQIISKAHFGRTTDHEKENLYLSGIFETILPITAKLTLAVCFVPA
ncbi:MAG: hypothetical protein BRC24_00360, partial [Parcubacteria group bacterium SW_4_46_8]